MDFSAKIVNLEKKDNKDQEIRDDTLHIYSMERKKWDLQNWDSPSLVKVFLLSLEEKF